MHDEFDSTVGGPVHVSPRCTDVSETRNENRFNRNKGGVEANFLAGGTAVNEALRGEGGAGAAGSMLVSIWGARADAGR